MVGKENKERKNNSEIEYIYDDAVQNDLKLNSWLHFVIIIIIVIIINVSFLDFSGFISSKS